MKFNEIKMKEDNLSTRRHIRHEKLDHEVHMAKSDLVALAQDSRDLLMLLQKYGSDERGIPGWIASKITKAQDYIKSVHKSLSYDSMDGEISEMFGISSNAKHRAKTIAMLDKMGIDSEKSGLNGLIIKGVAKPDQKVLLGKIRSDIGMFNSYTMDDINEAKFELHDPVHSVEKMMQMLEVDSPADIIADIKHWCDANNKEYANIEAIGDQYYTAELRAGTVKTKTNETASAGSTSAGSIATIANPHITKYKGPKPKKQKPSDNALNMKNVSIFGGPKKRK